MRILVQPLSSASALEALDYGLDRREGSNQLCRHFPKHRHIVNRIVRSVCLEAINLLPGRDVSKPEPYRGCLQHWPEKSGGCTVFAGLDDAYQRGMMFHRQIDGTSCECYPQRD